MPKTLAQRQLAKARKAQGSPLENRFLTLWKQLGGPELEQEYKFHPTRKWRFDFALEYCHEKYFDGNPKIAIEIEGGSWVNGAHSRGSHFQSDCEKYNAATALGWKVFRLTTNMITSEHLCPIIELCK